MRSSSLIEQVNATLRPPLETSRGQVSQETLGLWAWVHNHRPCGRGKWAGRTPLELLRGAPPAAAWLTLLLAHA